MTDSKTEKKIEQGEPTETRPPQLEQHEKVNALLEQWQEVWDGDKPKFSAQFPKWIVDAAAELFAHDMADTWNWNDYTNAAAVIISRHARAASPVAQYDKRDKAHGREVEMPEILKEALEKYPLTSPVARPQCKHRWASTSKNWKTNWRNSELRDYCLECGAWREPAARVEQPTPRTKMPLMLEGCLPTCGISYDLYHDQKCKHAPAAPVVEQREVDEPFEKVLARFCEAIIEHKKWLAASQRTEGEGQL